MSRHLSSLRGSTVNNLPTFIVRASTYCEKIHRRQITTTSPRKEDPARSPSLPSWAAPDALPRKGAVGARGPASSPSSMPKYSGAMGELSNTFSMDPPSRSSTRSKAPLSFLGSSPSRLDDDEDSHEPYHFHVYARKNNTHITVSKPNRESIISVSCGNLGFKNAGRKSYDAAYQLGAYVVDKLHQGNWHNKIEQVQVLFRGFGNGREAVTAILLGTEGRNFKHKIVSVADSTRVKFGGTRSKNPRRI